MKSVLAAIVGLGMASLAGSAVAQDATLVCLSSGQSYSPGQIVCIPGCHGAQRLARCDIVSGATSWTTVSNNCPTANLSPLGRRQTAMYTPWRPTTTR